jgi:hypothetical protein
MKSLSDGHEVIRTYVRFAFWLTHKSMGVTGRHHIPKGKLVIFAANHQNALIDPLALACKLISDNLACTCRYFQLFAFSFVIQYTYNKEPWILLVR